MFEPHSAFVRDKINTIKTTVKIRYNTGNKETDYMHYDIILTHMLGSLKLPNLIYKNMQMAVQCVKYTYCSRNAHRNRLLYRSTVSTVPAHMGCNLISLTAAEKCLRTYYYI